MTPALLSIRKYGDPVLRRKASPVEKVTPALLKTIQQMFATMYAEPGIGLAAPQVGISERIMVVDVAPEGKGQPLVFINPKIEETRGHSRAEEGCLSFPGIFVDVTRPSWVKVSAHNEKGQKMTVSGGGLLARCILHEMDHLDGKLMIDHVPLPQRWRVFWQIRKLKKKGSW